MHYSLEVIMPPVADVKAALDEILQPFDENDDDNSHSFWDWWQIGGRYSGHKTEATVSPEKIKEFHAELNRRGVTVSGIQFGKQELSPASQVPMVCPIFRHSGERSGADICTYKDIPPALTAYKLIVAAKDYKDEKLEAVTMFTQALWNGVTHEDTKWDGTVASGIAMHLAKLESYKDEYAAKITPQPDWMVVTVDYHS